MHNCDDFGTEPDFGHSPGEGENAGKMMLVLSFKCKECGKVQCRYSVESTPEGHEAMLKLVDTLCNAPPKGGSHPA